MRNHHALDQHASNLLLDVLKSLSVLVAGSEKMHDEAAEEVGMAVGPAELIRDGAEKVVPGLDGERHDQLLEELDTC